MQLDIMITSSYKRQVSINRTLVYRYSPVNSKLKSFQKLMSIRFQWKYNILGLDKINSRGYNFLKLGRQVLGRDQYGKEKLISPTLNLFSKSHAMHASDSFEFKNYRYSAKTVHLTFFSRNSVFNKNGFVNGSNSRKTNQVPIGNQSVLMSPEKFNKVM